MKVKPIGILDIEVEYRNIRNNMKFYVLKNGGQPLVGILSSMGFSNWGTPVVPVAKKWSYSSVWRLQGHHQPFHRGRLTPSSKDRGSVQLSARWSAVFRSGPVLPTNSVG
ncbi:hypothetical protein HHI36_016754 [Cryptolaemus montrouzieri]|uniref:Uncharacterized protein n=1 Tax=Cryptolaemus montrouzieri TaxID=559131 RepID=A0ABD2NKF7_9CUCU